MKKVNKDKEKNGKSNDQNEATNMKRIKNRIQGKKIIDTKTIYNL